MADQSPNLDNIQGNIVGFNKDHQAFLFVQLPEGEGAREWLVELVDDVATCREVKEFNQLFKLIRVRHHREGVVEATWVNVAFTHGGLPKLRLSADQLSQFPEAFAQGMRRAPSALVMSEPTRRTHGLRTLGRWRLMV